MVIKQCLDLRHVRTLAVHSRIGGAAVPATRCESVLGSAHSRQVCGLGDTTAAMQATSESSRPTEDICFATDTCLEFPKPRLQSLEWRLEHAHTNGSLHARASLPIKKQRHNDRRWWII